MNVVKCVFFKKKSWDWYVLKCVGVILLGIYIHVFAFCFARFPSVVKESLLKLGVPSAVLEFIFGWVDNHGDFPKIPEAKGSISAIRNEAFFIPLYELYLTYGGIFRLNLGPKVGLLLLYLYFIWN